MLAISQVESPIKHHMYMFLSIYWYSIVSDKFYMWKHRLLADCIVQDQPVDTT